MVRFLVHFIPIFSLSLWVGGGAAIGFIVAPIAFERAGSRQRAGELVGHILRRFDLYVFTFGPIAAICALLELLGSRGGERDMTLKLVLLGSMLALALYARFALSPEIEKIRASVGDGFDALPKTDRRRREFGRLHGFSVLCLLGQILLGALALGLSVMSLLRT